MSGELHSPPIDPQLAAAVVVPHAFDFDLRFSGLHPTLRNCSKPIYDSESTTSSQASAGVLQGFDFCYTSYWLPCLFHLLIVGVCFSVFRSLVVDEPEREEG